MESFSALQRAEIAEIRRVVVVIHDHRQRVSVLFNEPKLLKFPCSTVVVRSARVSVLFNEPKLLKYNDVVQLLKFYSRVSVLFNEPKLLKFFIGGFIRIWGSCFSALQRAEIAEIAAAAQDFIKRKKFQCSSTSRNC